VKENVTHPEFWNDSFCQCGWEGLTVSHRAARFCFREFAGFFFATKERRKPELETAETQN